MVASDDEPSLDQGVETKAGRGKQWLVLGIALMLISGVCFAGLFAVPFLSVSVGIRVLVGGAIYAAMQVTWWAGAAIAGSTVLSKWRKRPRRNRRERPESK